MLLAWLRLLLDLLCLLQSGRPPAAQSELPFRLLCRRYGATAAYTPMLHSRLFLEDERYRAEHFTTCEADRSACSSATCGHVLGTYLLPAVWQGARYALSTSLGLMTVRRHARQAAVCAVLRKRPGHAAGGGASGGAALRRHRPQPGLPAAHCTARPLWCATLASMLGGPLAQYSASALTADERRWLRRTAPTLACRRG